MIDTPPPREPQTEPSKKGKAGAQLRKDRGLPPSRVGQSQAPPPSAASEHRKSCRLSGCLVSEGRYLPKNRHGLLLNTQGAGTSPGQWEAPDATVLGRALM
jgi:hypothetical protein